MNIRTDHGGHLVFCFNLKELSQSAGLQFISLLWRLSCLSQLLLLFLLQLRCCLSQLLLLALLGGYPRLLALQVVLHVVEPALLEVLEAALLLLLLVLVEAEQSLQPVSAQQLEAF